MPRWASRITLEVTKVKVERLHDMTQADVEAEGFSTLMDLRNAWQTIYAKKPGLRWLMNPWVWAVSFPRHHGDRR